MSKIYSGDYGTVFTVTVRDQDNIIVNLAGASLSFVFLKPDGTSITRSGSLATDGSDGKAEYTVVDGDIDMDGVWSVQLSIVFPSGLWHTTDTNLTVYEPIS